MRDPLPESIDPRRQLSRGGRLAGIWPAARCLRVLGDVGRLLSDVSVDIRLTDALRYIVLDGQFNVSVELCCQRCLEPMRLEIDESMRLLLIPQAAQVEATEHYEQFELDEQGCIDTAQWIEDEILLHIPNVPLHSRKQECDPDILRRAIEYEPDPEQGNDKEENPFRVLKNWKDND